MELLRASIECDESNIRSKKRIMIKKTKKKKKNKNKKQKHTNKQKTHIPHKKNSPTHTHKN
jgi:hypothetical protein